ncbi:MAG TPA: helix-turn-helix transcriptional regulator [Alphaproteobacteria bacterium]|nr:helix-turn-helix transcriptional regulator [Alphaproteobacteria bacterium]
MATRSTNREDFQTVPRPIGAMAKDFPDGFFIPPHAHPRSQLIHASSGVMRISTPQGAFVVPPHRAVWVPANIVHDVRMAGAVAMRTLYILPDAISALPKECCVVAVSPLLRELILRATTLPLLYDEEGTDGRVMALILDELRVLPVLPLNLPMPRDPRLARICRAMLDDPADTSTLSHWGKRIGASSRTLARDFQRETGLTFGRWRQQARLLEALSRLAQGQSVTTIALDLGYDSPSAFTSMFRRALGRTPSSYFSDGRVAPARRRR